MKIPMVYILASKPNGVLYIGVTSDLSIRMSQHAQGLFEWFTKAHCVRTLVYYELFKTMPEAIAREKQLKHWNRAWKIRLIKAFNPEWLDLLIAIPARFRRGQPMPREDANSV